MSYNSYPFWLKNQADSASSDAMHSRREVDKCKEKLRAINEEIGKYKILESDNMSIKELAVILDKISEIVSK